MRLPVVNHPRERVDLLHGITVLAVWGGRAGGVLAQVGRRQHIENALLAAADDA